MLTFLQRQNIRRYINDTMSDKPAMSDEDKQALEDMRRVLEDYERMRVGFGLHERQGTE